jgi:hypothetical protein
VLNPICGARQQATAATMVGTATLCSWAGQAVHGKLPATAVNGPDDVGQARLLPTTSVDQLGAQLASWFGVSNSDLRTVLPYSSNFDLNRLKLFR